MKLGRKGDGGMGAVEGREWGIRSDQNTICTGLKFSRNLKLKII